MDAEPELAVPPGRRARAHRPPRGVSAAPARHRDARRGGRRADVRGRRSRRACAIATTSRSPRTDRAGRWPTPARASMCRSTTCGTSCATRTPTTTRGRARAARARARGSRRTSCRSTPPRPACSPGSRSPGSARRRCSRRTAGRSRAAAALREPCTRRPSAPSRRSATRSCASRTTTCGSRTSAASRRAAACTSSTTASTRPPRCRRGGRPASRLVLGCTARLAPPKDLITLLDALAQPGCERWELRVFGDGPDREAIERHRDELGLADRVTLLGNRDDVAAQLADCDAFALISDWEGLPYSILEAMAAGLPVLATRRGRHPRPRRRPGARASSCRRATLPPRAACSQPGPRIPRSCRASAARRMRAPARRSRASAWSGATTRSSPRCSDGSRDRSR